MRVEVGEREAGMRLDVLVSRATGLGRAGARRLFADGKVRVHRGAARWLARKGERAEAGTLVDIDVSPTPERPVPCELPLAIVLETSAIVIVDKPAGVPSAPLRPEESGTIANALLARYPEMRGVGHAAREPGLCHRLDTATSGLLLAARHGAAFEELASAISAGRLDKRYLLLCSGRGLDDVGTIAQPLEVRGARVRVSSVGRAALTRFRVLQRVGEIALVQAAASPATRHQIRAHFAAVGAPLLGDATYGGDCSRLVGRHALHASRLAYGGGAVVPAFAVDSPLPEDLVAILQDLGAPALTPAAAQRETP